MTLLSCFHPHDFILVNCGIIPFLCHMVCFTCLSFQLIKLGIVPLKDIINIYHSDWRVALCVTSGYSNLPRRIYVYDGVKLNEQLDKRCSRILAKKIRLDSSPPSILINSPSITLPKSLSCLLLASVSFVERTSGQDLSRNSISPPHLDDPRVWIPLITKYLQPEAQKLIDQIFQTHYRIYVLFDLPDYSHFKLLELADNSDEILNQEDIVIDRESSTVQLQESESREQQKDLSNDLAPEKNKRHSLAHHPGLKSHELAERDRSFSLDSPLKAPSQEQQPPKALNSLVTNLFSDNPPEAATASASNIDVKTRPPIPSSSASFPNPKGVSVKRTSIDELRVALQSDPTQQKSSTKGGKKKNFFGWKSSS